MVQKIKISLKKKIFYLNLTKKQITKSVDKIIDILLKIINEVIV